MALNLSMINQIQKGIISEYNPIHSNSPKMIWKTKRRFGKTTTLLKILLNQIEKTSSDLNVWMISNNQSNTKILYQKLNILLLDRYSTNRKVKYRYNRKTRIDLVKEVSEIENNEGSLTRLSITISHPEKKLTLPNTKIDPPDLILIDEIRLMGSYRFNQILEILESTKTKINSDYSNLSFFATTTNNLTKTDIDSLQVSIPSLEILTTDLKTI